MEELGLLIAQQIKDYFVSILDLFCIMNLVHHFRSKKVTVYSC